jgi:type IV pilus assembly protein PilA
MRLYSIAVILLRYLLLMKTKSCTTSCLTIALEDLEPRTSNLGPDSGFTLMELLIVMSIMLIIMAFAVPQMLKVKKTANQDSAIQTMRTVGSAEASYSTDYPGSGYACPLSALGGDPKSGAPSAQASQLIDPALATSGQKSGYIFTVTCGNKVTVNNQDVYTSYTLTGVPQTVGKTGDRGYCSDENNIIKFDPAGGTNCTQTTQ